jgi:hypothetical protein
VLSWLLPPEEAGELAVRVELEDERSLAVVAESRGGWDQVRPTHARLLGPDGTEQTLELAPAGPGRYRARLEGLSPGAYVVQVEQAMADGTTLRGEGGWVTPYPAEYRLTGVDLALLGQVAAAGGGQVLGDAGAALLPVPRQAVARWPLMPLLLVLAALAWPLEIAARRLALPSAAPWLLARGRLRVPRAATAAAGLAAARASGPAAPAATTTAQLLERKRTFRARQRERS